MLYIREDHPQGWHRKMTVTDQLGRQLFLEEKPMRIISVVPSQTEYLYDIGLGDQIVGQTTFCVHPEDKFKKANKIGGTKKLNIARIRTLKPDIIIANKEENEKAQIEELSKEFPVWVSDIKTMDDALDMMRKLGEIFDKKEEAEDIIHQISDNFTSMRAYHMGKPKTVLYLIWQKPYMAAGRDTFINELLNQAGLKNVIKEPESRYPKIFVKDMEDYKPDYVFLSTEPFPFNQTHVAELQQLLPGSIVKLADGEMFSWYGSRMLQVPEYFGNLLV